MAVGEELSQYDSLVFHACLKHMVETRHLPGQMVESTASHLCSIYGASGGSEHRLMWDSLKRMKRCEIHVKNGSGLFIGNIFSNILKTGKGVGFEFNSSLLGLLTGSDGTFCDISEKAKLRSNIAKWAIDYYASHSSDSELDFLWLKKMCGSEASDAEFKRMLSKALEEVKAIGAIGGWSIVGKKVSVSISSCMSRGGEILSDPFAE